MDAQHGSDHARCVRGQVHLSACQKLFLIAARLSTTTGHTLFEIVLSCVESGVAEMAACCHCAPGSDSKVAMHKERLCTH